MATQLSGKVGQLIYRQTKYGTVVYEAPSKASIPQRTEAQMQVRTQWGQPTHERMQSQACLSYAEREGGNAKRNMAAVYRQFNQTLKKGFEGINGKMNDYNAFIQANTNVVKVYVPKSVRLNGGSVLAPYQITRGSLPSIAMSKNGSNVLVSDLNLGSLVWDVVSQIGFSSVPAGGSGASGYKLGMSVAIADGAAVWIHSREDSASGSGGLRVSTQFLFVDSSVLAGYQGSQAMAASANSYGGINTSAVYLNPRSGAGSGAGSVVTPVTGGGSTNQNDGSTSSPQGGNQGGGFSETPSGGGQAGGSDTGGTTGGETGGTTGGGSESVSVAAPTFSGETQFTETTEVTMSAESGAEIRYTLDGSTPTSASTLYTGPVTLSDTTPVKAIAIKDGVSSGVTSRTYTKSAGNGGDDDEVEGTGGDE